MQKLDSKSIFEALKVCRIITFSPVYKRRLSRESCLGNKRSYRSEQHCPFPTVETRSVVRIIQTAMLNLLDEDRLHFNDNSYRLIDRIRNADSVASLWYLRVEFAQVLCLSRGETNAMNTIADLDILFGI